MTLILIYIYSLSCARGLMRQDAFVPQICVCQWPKHTHTHTHPYTCGQKRFWDTCGATHDVWHKSQLGGGWCGRGRGGVILWWWWFSNRTTNRNNNHTPEDDMHKMSPNTIWSPATHTFTRSHCFFVLCGLLLGSLNIEYNVYHINKSNAVGFIVVVEGWLISCHLYSVVPLFRSFVYWLACLIPITSVF